MKRCEWDGCTNEATIDAEITITLESGATHTRVIELCDEHATEALENVVGKKK